jgi:uncharacterized protein involved in type VI secretion and phage assembly
MGDARYNGQQTFDGIEEGIVVENVDPDGRARVRVVIPSIVDDSSSWAFPFGTVGGGSANAGFWSVPAIGSTVVCFFIEGDVDEIYYCTSGWSRSKSGESQTPSAVQAAIAEDGPAAATKVSTFSSSRFELVFDEREEKGRVYLRSKRHEDSTNNGTGLMIEFDDEQGMIGLSAPGGIRIKSLGNIDIESGTQLALQGRVVNPMGDVI